MGSTLARAGRQILRRSASVINSVVNVNWGSLTGGGLRGVAGWLRAFNRSARLHSVLARIAEDVASAKLRAYMTLPGDEEVELNKGPLVDWMRNPWKTMGGGSLYSLLYLSSLWLELTGEVFWLVRHSNGHIIEVWPIPPSWVHSTPNDNPKGGFGLCVPNLVLNRRLDGQPKDLLWVPAEDMLWIRRHNPENPFGRGAGRAQAVDDEVTQEELCAKFANSFFRNHARPDVVVFLEGLEDNPGQVKKLREQWDEQHRGALSAYRPAFLPASGKLQSVQGSLKELALAELRDLNRDIQWQLWSMPPEILGSLQNSNKATIEAADYHYSLRVLLPKLEFFAAELNRLWVPRFYATGRVSLRFDNPVKETKEFQLEKNNEMWTRGGITRNEYRVANGKPPFPPGDPRGDDILVPSNTAVLRPDGSLLVVAKANELPALPTPKKGGPNENPGSTD